MSFAVSLYFLFNFLNFLFLIKSETNGALIAKTLPAGSATDPEIKSAIANKPLLFMEKK